MRKQVRLREVRENDLGVFFEHQGNPHALQMAAFTPRDSTDRKAFDDHWSRITAVPTVMIRTILSGNEVAGDALSYEESRRTEVSYWIGKAFWGQVIATSALQLLSHEVNRRRPIYARMAKDNLGSIRVLQKSHFRVIGEATGFANPRGERIEELLFKLSEDEDAVKQHRSLCHHLFARPSSGTQVGESYQPQNWM